VKVRNLTLKDQMVITRFGEMSLDANGYPTNLEDLGCSAEEVLKHVPGFADDKVFPLDNPVEVAEVVKEEQKEEKGREYTDEDYAAVIAELVDNDAPLNSEDYIEMEFLAVELRRRGMPVISGGKRKELQDKPPKGTTDGNPTDTSSTGNDNPSVEG